MAYNMFSSVKNLSNSVLMRQIRTNLYTTSIGSNIARVQEPAPAWTANSVIKSEFKTISSSDYRGKFLVMVFYPLDFTFVCPTELVAFSDKIQEFKDRNTEVVGISCDSHFSHLAWNQQSRKEGGLGLLEFPLVSDYNKEIAANYNVLVKKAGHALRGLFIIDDQGILRISHINDLPIGRNVDEVIRLVDAIQFSDKHGEVCPANWQKGGATIKPTVKDSKSYFETK